jgi:hypothetical protein
MSWLEGASREETYKVLAEARQVLAKVPIRPLVEWSDEEIIELLAKDESRDLSYRKLKYVERSFLFKDWNKNQTKGSISLWFHNNAIFEMLVASQLEGLEQQRRDHEEGKPPVPGTIWKDELQAYWDRAKKEKGG